MELDELKSAWQTLDRHWQQQSQLNERWLAGEREQRVRHGLLPLRVGQVLQILFGVGLALWAGAFWFDHRDEPHLLAAGLLVQAYGVLTIVFAVHTIVRARRVDPSAPVLDVQKALARLRTFYVRSNVGLGLAWWVLWLPVAMLVLAPFGIDLYQAAPAVLCVGAAIGAVGLLVTGVFARWAFDPRHPERAASMRAHMAGASLLRAQRQLDEIARFENG